VTHRDPIVVVASVSSLLANLRWVHSDHVDLTEIGRYHVDLFHRTLDDLARRDAARELQPTHISHSHYADFIDKPFETVRGIYDQLGLELTPETERRMEAHLDARPKGRHGEHRYDFADLGLDRADTVAGFERYVSHFAVPTSG
jgi:hypothetical protein